MLCASSCRSPDDPAPPTEPAASVATIVRAPAADESVGVASSASEVRPARIRQVVGAQQETDDCYRGFRSSGTPDVDVTRLGMLCGPAAGLTFAHDVVRGRLDEDGPARSHSVTLQRGECMSCFAAGNGVEDVEVEFLGPDGVPLGHANRGEPWVVFPEQGPHCPQVSGAYQVLVRTHGGSGPYSLSVWSRRLPR